MKGFICTGVLFLPNAVLNGGYGFSAIMIFFGAALTYISAMKLLQVKAKIKAGSYTEIGTKLFGAPGKIAVQIAVGCSQVSFCVGMIYFMVENIGQIFRDVFGLEALDSNRQQIYTPAGCSNDKTASNYTPDCQGVGIIKDWEVGLGWFIIFTFMCWVRKIEVFAATHIFGDVMILATVVIIIIYAALDLNRHGGLISPGEDRPAPPATPLNTEVYFLNPINYADVIGFAVFAFEGVGLILPIQDITRNKE